MDPELAALVAQLPEFEPAGPVEARARARAYSAERPPVPGRELLHITDQLVPGSPGADPVPVRVYRPPDDAASRAAIIYVHGGGFIAGDLDTEDLRCVRFAREAGCVVVSVDYRLAPEHPHPAAVQDARAAVAWASGAGAEQLGTEPGRLVVGGDSAGGNLAAVAARHLRDAVRAQILVYPATDARMAGESYREHADFAALPAAAMGFCWKTYVGDGDAEDPDVSPLRATDLDGLPAALVVLAGFDVLRDDGLAYADALRAAGVEARVERFDDMPHGFLRWGGIVDRGGEVVRSLSAFARSALDR
jgi:acetyl esterase